MKYLVTGGLLEVIWLTKFIPSPIERPYLLFIYSQNFELLYQYRKM